MRKISLLITAFFILTLQSIAQTGAGDDFESYNSTNPLSPTWTSTSQYSLSIYKSGNNNQLLVNCNKAGVNYGGFPYSFSSIDVTDKPYLSIKVKSGTSFTLRIDMIDAAGRSTNQLPITQTVKADNLNYYDYFFDFSGRFYQQYGTNNGVVNSAQITKILITVNPAAPGTPGYTGSFMIDSVMIGSRVNTADIPVGSQGIKINQVGFFKDGYKRAVVSGASTTTPKFYIVKDDLSDTLWEGNLQPSQTWAYSGESVRIADFSGFNIPGKYKMRVSGITTPSYTFTISETILNGLSKGSIRGFYYQRASTAIPATYGGIWARAAGHPDKTVYIHPSAASPGRPAGSVISSPKGWYDAGDYNKYIVNSGISTYTLLACYEHFPTYYDTLKLNIPESNNNLPDVLDEALWNLRWMLTMQDADGGVYHKLTNEDFDQTVMPADATNKRYVVKKCTPATLDFAAVMAQASRIFINYNSELPGFADSCIKASVKAYEWAIYNPAIYYNQSALPEPAINTGVYGDGNASDEFIWAASELFTTTLKKWYYLDKVEPSLPRNCDRPDWPNVYTLGFISMSHNRVNIVDSLPNVSDTTMLMKKVISYADSLIKWSLSSPYGIVMGGKSGDFGWGSNSVAANQALVLIQAFNYTKDSTYLKGALSNLDYLMGRNATGYSFVTGFGSKPSNNIHHRPSQADGIAAAVPGLLAGGPNSGQNDNCPGYPSSLPALSYVDSDCSYSTNEIAINWNAPLAYISGSLQSIFSGIEPEAKSYEVSVVTANQNAVLKNIKINLYPNPTSSSLFIVKPFDLVEEPAIIDLNGNEFPVTGNWTGDTFEINTSNLKNGVYLIRLQGENGAAVQKFNVIK
ncbi:MAG: glycoside hydrolase family 9 protein [Cytophaga sp.]|uniref:glycoside hydrolase family 9 protein n=1 Tax=Cytophaga sp. TaxID=29535 RepID=UPI003F812DB2